MSSSVFNQILFILLELAFTGYDQQRKSEIPCCPCVDRSTLLYIDHYHAKFCFHSTLLCKHGVFCFLSQLKNLLFDYCSFFLSTHCCTCPCDSCIINFKPMLSENLFLPPMPPLLLMQWPLPLPLPLPLSPHRQCLACGIRLSSFPYLLFTSSHILSSSPCSCSSSPPFPPLPPLHRRVPLSLQPIEFHRTTPPCTTPRLNKFHPL